MLTHLGKRDQKPDIVPIRLCTWVTNISISEEGEEIKWEMCAMSEEPGELCSIRTNHTHASRRKGDINQSNKKGVKNTMLGVNDDADREQRSRFEILGCMYSMYSTVLYLPAERNFPPGTPHPQNR